MYFTYILRSQINNKYYIGSCEDVDKRVKRHNAGMNKSTKQGRPWNIIHTETFTTRAEAVRREMQIKSYKGGNAFKTLIKK